MKTIVVVTLVALIAQIGYCWEYEKNPDHFPSFGMEVSKGKLAGLLKDTAAGGPHTDGGFVQGHLDLRLPVSNNVTVHFLGESTAINNNLQFSEGNRVGAGIRVYIQ